MNDSKYIGLDGAALSEDKLPSASTQRKNPAGAFTILFAGLSGSFRFGHRIALPISTNPTHKLPLWWGKHAISVGLSIVPVERDHDCAGDPHDLQKYVVNKGRRPNLPR